MLIGCWRVVLGQGEAEAQLDAGVVERVDVVPVGIADRPLPSVHPSGRDDPGDAVPHLQNPDSRMDFPVMPGTGQREIREIGAAVVPPVPHMVAFTAMSFGLAAGDHTASIAGIESPPLGCADGPREPS